MLTLSFIVHVQIDSRQLFLRFVYDSPQTPIAVTQSVLFLEYIMRFSLRDI